MPETDRIASPFVLYIDPSGWLDRKTVLLLDRTTGREVPIHSLRLYPDGQFHFYESATIQTAMPGSTEILLVYLTGECLRYVDDIERVGCIRLEKT